MTAPIMYYGTPQGGVIAEIDMNAVLDAVLTDTQHLLVVTLAGGWTAMRGPSIVDPMSMVLVAGRELPVLHALQVRLEARHSREVVMQPVFSALYEMATMGGIALLLSFAVAWRLGRRLAQPIRQLTDRVSRGEHPCAPVGTSDELEILAQRLDEQRERLLEANRELEHRVQERTHALEKQAQALQRSNADLEQFAYVSSHDLQEPLRMVKSFCELIRGRCEGTLDETSRNHFGYVIEGAQRMQSLLDALLAYSRVNAVETRQSLVDCNQVVRDVLKDLQVAIVEADAHVQAQTLPDVIGDPVQLRQVFQNLVANAIKFRGEEPPRVEISARPSAQDQWTFRVQDNGIGMKPNHTAKIFQMFQRLNERGAYSGRVLG